MRCSRQESIIINPTAEAHTFLGLALGSKGQLNQAIQECEKTILLDPEFGNPYNDIGAYLIELGKLDKAIPYLERAMQAKRYDTPHYPHFNIARIYMAKGMIQKAMDELKKSLRLDPEYAPAKRELMRLRGMLNCRVHIDPFNVRTATSEL